MKLPNLTRAGRTALVFAATAFLLPGCDSEDPPETGSSESGSQSSETEDSGDTETTDPTTTGADTEPDPSDSESSGGESGTPVEGLGCDPPPACDKGEFSGSPTITNIEEANEIAGYTSVTGRLAVANSDFECLAFLSCMESVGHDLSLFGNDLLTDVTGLDNIAEIGAVADGPLMPGGTLSVSENAALLDFNTLNLIEQTPVTLSIGENDNLEAISGLQGLVGTFGDFEIRFNPKLKDIGSESLRDILFIGGECVVTNNDSLCISTIEDMCSIGIKQGPFGGSTANNDNGC
ncbi:MAG: hypothetical protein ACRBN8_17260 [Nannocystales bacterium]